MSLTSLNKSTEYQGFIKLFAPDGSHVREHGAIKDRIGDYGFAQIHGLYILSLQPERVLCIGSRYGYIPAYMAWVCRAEELKTHIDFVDANYDDTNDGFLTSWGGVGAWYTPIERFKQWGLEEYITPHIRRTDEFFQKCAHKYGYVYFDGNHSYEGVKYDFEHALVCSTATAKFAFHDTIVEEPGFGVQRFIKELDRVKWSIMNYVPWPGLAVVSRTDA